MGIGAEWKVGDARHVWFGTASLTKAEAIERVYADMQDNPSQSAAQFAFTRTADNKQLCPTGLIEERVLPMVDVDTFTDMLKAPPFDGGSQAQPQRVLDGLRIVANRRGLHQRRVMRAMAEANKKAGANRG